MQLEDGEELSLPTSPAVNSPPTSAQPAQNGVAPSPHENTGDEPEDVVREPEFEDPRNSANFNLAPKRMVALYDYDPQQLSPNQDNEVFAYFFHFFTCQSCGLIDWLENK